MKTTFLELPKRSAPEITGSEFLTLLANELGQLVMVNNGMATVFNGGGGGAAGQDGEDGTPATIMIGSVTTGDPGTEAAVENVGTDSAAILNFTIPAGEPGEDGEDGSAGVGGFVTPAPIGTTSDGSAGQYSTDGNFFYSYDATMGWRRAPLYAFGPGVYQYVSDGDANGVLYGRGLAASGTSNWINPHTAGAVTVVTSPLASGTAAQLVDRSPNNMYTTNVSLSFMGVDLGSGNALRINKYSVRTRSGGADNFPRNWKLQATNSVSANTEAGWNAATWVDLDTQVANTTISSESGWVSLPVTDPAATPYRYFRMLQTGANSSGSQLLIVSELEFYGSLNL